MAQKVVLLDDISGEEDAQTVVVGWDGDWYEIDVAEKNRQALEKALEKYIEHARPASKKPKSSTAGLDLSQVRQWARDNGHEVGDKGRVPAAIVDEYRKAHQNGS